MNSYVIGGLFGIIGAVGLAAIVWRRSSDRRLRRGLLLTLTAVMFAVSVTSIGFGRWMAGGDRSPIAAAEIVPGLTYERLIIDDAVAHLLRFDVADGCLQLITTEVRPDWLVVDGKRPGYSEGVTFDEAAEFLASVGATDAVAMDGGGSTAMVANDGSGVRMLNQTINQGIPDRERAIANHLGLIRPADCG